MDSILTSLKKLLGINKEYVIFDMDLIIHINSIFSILNQLGAGPSNGFSIEDEEAEWSDFLPINSKKLEFVKSYMYLKLKLIFDPPLSSGVIESIKSQISELEWRIQVASDDQDQTDPITGICQLAAEMGLY